MKGTISSIMSPNGQIAPDIKLFKSPAVLPGNNCNSNDKPLFLDVESGTEGIDITICTFLAFELDGDFFLDDALDNLEEYIKFEFDTGYTLKGN